MKRIKYFSIGIVFSIGIIALGCFFLSAAVDKSGIGEKTVFIQYFGDSTVFGADPEKLNSQVSLTAPLAMEQSLDQKYGPFIVVSNEGVSGTKTDHFLNGDQAVWKNIMRRSTSNFVIVNWGMNDAWFDPGVSVDLYRSELMDLFLAAKSTGKTLVFETPNPISESNKPFGDSAKAARLQSLVDAMRSVAKETGSPLIDQYQYVKTIDGWEDLIPDGVHPSPELYKLKGEYAATVMTPLIDTELWKNRRLIDMSFVSKLMTEEY
ncbi:SGNH/GDSL hydrolase family protein [Aeromonas rivipollensis]|uniref:SGNH/GDSL hydrolase family protein n=1 Tax=Aeromonas rivipollensis TaxID=948519 RepID=UPI00373AE216